MSIDSTIAGHLRDRLGAAGLDPAAEAVVLAAVGTGGRAPSAEGATSGGVYLRSVSVQGFRGIGSEATLPLQPRPGLTVVVGRNGSGKSSFAEGLELLMTGTTKRWDAKAKAWSSAWQCLHHTGATRVAAELVVAGETEPVRLERTWEHGAAYTDASGSASAVATLAGRGWDSALASFRPFLSYDELASMFDKLTSLYEALSPVLGLEDVDRVLKQVSDERLGLENAAKDVRVRASALASGLDPQDGRAVALKALIEKRTPDLAAIGAHIDAHPPGLSADGPQSAALRARATRSIPDDVAATEAWEKLADAEAERQEHADTDTDRARRIAALLEQAVSVRDTGRLVQDCPVCETPGVLDAAWDARAQAAIRDLRATARGLDAAVQAAGEARRHWEAVLQQLGVAADGTVADAHQAAATLRQDAAEAREALEGLDHGWRTTTEATNVWLAAARAAAAQAGDLKAAKAAETWLKGVADDLRTERFAPIAAQALANWQELRHESNVELRDIRLKSVGRRREAAFDVRADGEDASALGVMSQGELLALSVSVFLPRAGLDESPFRFAVIDDPVQSMDPAKVEGLARILARAAATRQVVVFTHDDRLPDAIRRLRLPAEVHQVLRQSRSRVTVRQVRSPLLQHLHEARTMARSDRVPDGVRQRVVPTLCRGAVEAACADLVRTRAVREGRTVAEADELLDEARTLRHQLALALFGPAASTSCAMRSSGSAVRTRPRSSARSTPARTATTPGRWTRCRAARRTSCTASSGRREGQRASAGGARAARRAGRRRRGLVASRRRRPDPPGHRVDDDPLVAAGGPRDGGRELDREVARAPELPRSGARHRGRPLRVDGAVGGVPPPRLRDRAHRAGAADAAADGERVREARRRPACRAGGEGAGCGDGVTRRLRLGGGRLDLLLQPVPQHGVHPDAEFDLGTEHLRFGVAPHPGPRFPEGGELSFDVREVALVDRPPVARVQQRGEEEAQTAFAALRPVGLRLDQPASQRGASGRRDPVGLAAARSVPDHLDQVRGLELGELGIDLAVPGVPRRPQRPVERLGQLVAGRGTAGEKAEHRVTQGHRPILARTCSA
jgi:hypothetical protein